MSLQNIHNTFNRKREQHLERLFELLRLKSISADETYRDACHDCASRLLERVTALGFTGTLQETTGQPVVLAERAGNSSAPHLLIYGHYDVQPVSPVDAWDNPPFEPVVRNDRILARGAQDNKGQLSYVLAAIEDAVEEETPLPTITLLLEGGEEVGSPGLSAALPSLQELIRSDILLVCDTNAADDGRCAIVAGLRGIVHLSIRLNGPDHDLHSGLHGGTAPNPLQGMAELIASLFNADGSIAVEGYMDNITPPSDIELAMALESEPTAKDYISQTGCPPSGGPHDQSFAARHSFLPTIDINGLHGGCGEKGMKTIIPASAIAKISSRLVPGQDPQWCLDALIQHLETRCPDGMCLEVTESGVGGPGFRLDIRSDAFGRARSVLEQLDDRGAVLLWEGASIPIVSALAATSGAEPLLVGFGSQEDRIHAPNESFGLDQFAKGYAFVALLLRELAE